MQRSLGGRLPRHMQSKQTIQPEMIVERKMN